MFVAIDSSGERVFADEADDDAYTCPACGEPVRLRAGEINAAHFAHLPGTICVDYWNYDMSEWHLRMQEKFDEQYREVVVKHNGQTHRADILKDGVVIEFQHSPISYSEIRARNEFYTRAGYKVAWIFDMEEHWDDMECTNPDKPHILRWRNPLRSLRAFRIGRESDVSLWFCIDSELDEYERPSEIPGAPPITGFFYHDYIRRVDWSTTDDYDECDFKWVAISDTYELDVQGDMDLLDLFRTDRERVRHLLAQNRPYWEKVEHIRGYPGPAYKCFLDGHWIDGRCQDCKHNILSTKSNWNDNPRGIKHYCKYGRGLVTRPVGMTEPPLFYV